MNLAHEKLIKLVQNTREIYEKREMIQINVFLKFRF